MSSEGLVARLNQIWRDGDHERLCQGREYSCTCGFDNRTEATAKEAADRISALEAEVERLKREVEVWREGWEDDGRDVRYFSKAMSAQQRPEDLCAKLKLAQTTINFVRRWAVEKEGNGTSAEERLSVIANHPGIALHSIRED